MLAGEYILAKKSKAVVLHYRRINHGERTKSIEMKAGSNYRYLATIPASYTNSPYPLPYYFEVKETPQVAAIYPGLGKELKDQPYFVMRQA